MDILFIRSIVTACVMVGIEVNVRALFMDERQYFNSRKRLARVLFLSSLIT